jgi:biotin transport system substrate-specific component
MASQEQLKLESWAAPAAATRVEPWRRALLVLAMVALIAVCARLAVPLPGTPVPVTLQDLAVMVIGIVLGPVQGAVAVASYVLIGALGAPVFANGGGGLAVLMGPTGGYLIAFPIVAFILGHATRRGRPVWLLLLGLVAAQVVMFTGGVLQLALVTGQGLSTAVGLGVIPFLPGVAFKSAVLVVFALALRRSRR